jgi:hypothetical protein
MDKTHLLVRTTSDYIEYEITSEILKEAERRNSLFYKKYGNAGTHRTDKSRQRMTGYLAEIAIKNSYPQLDYSESDEVDFIFKDKTFDSKAQGCNSIPLPHYVATYYEEQKKRNVDFLIFSRVKNDFSKVWICGIISKKEFFEKSILIPAGVMRHNFVYDNPRFELEFKNLYKPNFFKNKKQYN